MGEVRNGILLARIDERVGYLAKCNEIQELDIQNLKQWMNRTVGATSILGVLCGYLMLVI